MTIDGRLARCSLKGCIGDADFAAAQHMAQFELEGKNPPPMPESEFS